MTFKEAYAVGFLLLGAWGLYSSRQPWQAGRPWSRLRWQIFLADLLFTLSCFLCATGLLADWFRGWMLLPLGASLVWMIPLPCYFDAVNRRGWLHSARNLLFVAVVVACFLLGVGLVSISRVGL